MFSRDAASCQGLPGSQLPSHSSDGLGHAGHTLPISPPAALAPSPLSTAWHSLFPKQSIYCTLLGPLSTPPGPCPHPVPGGELLVPGCWWPVAGGIRKHPPAHSSTCTQHRDSAGCGGCACSAAAGTNPSFLPNIPSESQDSCLWAKGTHADMAVLQMPCPGKGAACPACPGSQCSSPPAHPSLPLWALQPPALRAEGGRFLSRWKISLLRSSELSPACHTQSICLSTLLFARLQAQHLSHVLAAPGSHCRVLPLHTMSILGSPCPCSLTGCKTPAGLK